VKLKYGTFTHEINEVSLQISVTPEITERGDKIADIEIWNISGLIIGTSIVDLTTKIDAIKAAYAINNQDIELLTDGGSSTSHSMFKVDVFGDIRVTSGPSFPEGNGVEYATVRTFNITVEGRTLDPSALELLAFSDSISIDEGIPDFTHLIPIEGVPQKQFVNEQTPWTASQQGTAVGKTAYPFFAVPSPAFPDSLKKKNIAKVNPKFDRGSLIEFQISWSYQFESADELDANPNF